MPNKEGHATEETIGKSDVIAEENEPNIVALEFEASNRRQRKLLHSIRLYAIGLFAFVMVGVGVAYSTDTNDNVQTMTSDSVADASISKSYFGARGNTDSSSPYKLPKVQQPKMLLSHEDEDHPDHEGFIRKLRDEFHEWAVKHGRDYGSKDEKEKRFLIWKENHFRTQEKNERHGTCRLTGQAVFGSNHFKDLTPEEFHSKYLTGYSGPHTDRIPHEHERRRLRSDQFRNIEDILKSGPASGPSRRHLEPEHILSSNGLHDPAILSDKIRRHKDVQDRYLKHIQETPKLDKTYYSKEEKQNEKVCKCGSSNVSSNSSNRLLKSITEKFPKFGKTYYSRSEKQKVCGYSKTYYSSNRSSNTSTKVDCSKYKMEQGDGIETSNTYKYSNTKCSWYDASCWLQTLFTPIYTSSSEKYYGNYNYPSAMDWRKVGAVTSVHSQGSCGACWAITAVETIESVNYIKTGTLYDLSETEVVICDTSCEMCDGGWPQNAYQYAIDNNGLPKDGTYSYDGDFLMTMTTVLAGESDELTEDDLADVYANTCPSSDANSQSNDNNDDTVSSVPRYGAVNGYAYATDRCVCYTDGSGCDCDEQNENLAVMNVASYGPATICLDASTWQDYSGGIITADSGCSSAFLDMNHCVQAVGYAFMEVEDEDGDENNSRSGSNSNSNDENGNKQLEGYWIIRNQWSSYWGMSGYAYVSMGSNTCGVLNDMTQVFMD